MKTFSFFVAAMFSAACLSSVVLAKDQGVGAPVDPATLASTPPIDHVVYLAHLPAPADLSKAASSQGSSIVRMDETGDHIVVVYQYTSGKTVTFAYTLLSAAPVAPTENLHAEALPAEAHQVTTTTVAQPSTVVYTTAPAPAYYYSSYYSPFWNFWAPLAVGIGLSYAWYGGGYYYHGGGHYHGGGDWHGGGGWHSGGGGHH
jgi:hypothetical protein